MLTAFITHPDCARHEMGADHPECPERLAAIHDRLLTTGLLDYMAPYDAPLAGLAELGRAHAPSYVQDLIDCAPTDGLLRVDPDTCMNPFTLQAARRSAGAVLLATDLVLAGQASNSFCSVRPPGHHAERATAMGFCFFNNVAVGIRHALDTHGLERVALIDFDVHHGNGSEDIFQDEPRVLMCSTFETGIYPFCGEHGGRANMINVALPPRSGGDVFRAAVTRHWLPALDRFAPQLIYISAGFDGHREDDMGNLGLVESDYTWVTREIMRVAQGHCAGRVISCLEGGYALGALGRSVAAHVKVLIGAD
ncbi:deacetylase [Variovorax sp. WS11]|uniref:histone deacetylase family protein n=1 Tax=Variovorax sp. WS11 TaxID=1105204 RepID=UPI000D0DF99B|nr:histone deacetylase family protein [Variovorax sp. WS11]NDZ18509.1 histone deacetylase family protein [Variovorax sp. WS11]PSL85145.1 deacetylase [Variovorax sp. WS11]